MLVGERMLGHSRRIQERTVLEGEGEKENKEEGDWVAPATSSLGVVGMATSSSPKADSA